MPRWLSWWFRRPRPWTPPPRFTTPGDAARKYAESLRGTRPDGSPPPGGSVKPSAYTDTKLLTGTRNVTLRHAAECSFSIRRGTAWVEEAIPPTLRLASNYGALTASGPVTAARGGNGQPPDSAA